MKTNKLIKLYKENAEKNSPDMDSIWEKIEGNLEPKPEGTVTSKPLPKKITFRRAAVWAAVCAAALIIFPVSVRIINTSREMSANESMTDESPMPGTAPMTQSAAVQDVTEAFSEYAEAADEGIVNEETEEVLPSDGLYTADAESFSSYRSSGNEYFVEENVLIQTDVIVNAYVDRVYSKGNSTCYEISAKNAETGETENITLESGSIYTMKQDGNYILPLKNENGSYSLAFENAPQIEETESGGLVFHNGWISLDENSVPAEYPQVSADDFFYDRMRSSYSNDISPLLEKWHEVRQE